MYRPTYSNTLIRPSGVPTNRPTSQEAGLQAYEMQQKRVVVRRRKLGK